MRLRPRAEAVCFKGLKVLADMKPYVCFPGGGIDPGETPVEAAKRECMEEAGRVLQTCTVAHPPSVQHWPADRMEWQKGADGGITYWMTGSTSEDATDKTHEDYQPGFKWYPIEDVVTKLKAEMHGDWSDDVKVRLAILEAHLRMHKTIDSVPASERAEKAASLVPLAALRLP